MSDSFKSKGILDCSIVVPVYNEEESLRDLFGEILKVMTPMRNDYEVIFVDDCSSDASSKIINDFCDEFPEVAKNLPLTERSGQTYALKQGLESAIGKIVISLDADLQNDPGDIPRLLEKMKEGYDCVCGWRKSRQDTVLKAAMSKFGNVMQRLFTGMKIHDVSCTLRAYKKECVGKIALNWEGQHRFIPLSLSLQGYRVGEIVSNHRKRKYGYSKYNHRRVFRVVVDFFRVLSVRGKK